MNSSMIPTFTFWLVCFLVGMTVSEKCNAAEEDPKAHLDQEFGWTAASGPVVGYEMSIKVRAVDAHGNKGPESIQSIWVPVDAHPIPEPGRDVLLLAGVAMVILLRRVR